MVSPRICRGHNQPQALPFLSQALRSVSPEHLQATAYIVVSRCLATASGIFTMIGDRTHAADTSRSFEEAPPPIGSSVTNLSAEVIPWYLQYEAAQAVGPAKRHIRAGSRSS